MKKLISKSLLFSLAATLFFAFLPSVDAANMKIFQQSKTNGSYASTAISANPGDYVYYNLSYLTIPALTVDKVELSLNANLLYVDTLSGTEPDTEPAAGNSGTIVWNGGGAGFQSLAATVVQVQVDPSASAGAINQQYTVYDGGVFYEASDSITINVTNKPQISSAVTGDSDNDGKIDQYTLTFSKDMNAAGTHAGFEVGGVAATGGSWTNATTFVLTFAEGASYDTGDTPQLTYSSAAGDMQDTEGAPNDLEDIAAGDLSETDGAEPVVITSSPQDVTSNGNVIIQFSESMDSATTKAAADLKDPSSVSVSATETLSGNTLTYDPDSALTQSAAYSVVVGTTAEDISGNTLEAESTTTFNVAVDPDNTAPGTCTLTINEGTLTKNSSVNLTISASDSQSTVTEMYIDGDVTDTAATKEWISYATAKAVTLDTAADGAKTITIKFKDSAGNANSAACATDTITLDTTDPTSSASPAGGTFSADQSITLSATDLSSTTIYYEKTTDGSEPANPTTASTVYAAPISAVDTETTKIKFFAVDAAGNNQAVANMETYIVNSAAPVITVDSQTKSPNTGLANYLTTGQNTDVVWYVSGSAGGNGNYRAYIGTDTTPCDTGGANESELTAGATAYTDGSGNTITTNVDVTDLAGADGNYKLELCVNDGANNAVQTIVFTKDTVVPTGTLVIDGDAEWATDANSTLNLTATDATAGVYEMDVTGTNMTDLNTVSYAATQAITLTTEGTVTANVVLRDRAGNESATLSDTIKYDETAPVISFSPAAGAQSSSTINVTITSDDANGTVYYTTDGSAPDTNSSSNTGITTTISNLSLNATVKAFAVDQAGNQSTTSSAAYTYSAPAGGGGGGGGGGSSVAAAPYSMSETESSTPLEIDDRDVDLPDDGDNAGVFTRETTFVSGDVQVFIPQFTEALNEDGTPFTGVLSLPQERASIPASPPSGFDKVDSFQFLTEDKSKVTFNPPVQVEFVLDEDFEIPEDKNLNLYYWNEVDSDTAMSSLLASATYIAATDNEEGYYELVENAEIDSENKKVVASVSKTGQYVVFESSGDAPENLIPEDSDVDIDDDEVIEFTDIIDHWAESYINTLFNKGVVKGKSEGVFDPNTDVTRAELAKIALLSFDYDIDEDAESTDFSDVSSDAWYLPYVAAAKTSGVVEGYEDGTFKPNNPVNRAEALKMLVAAKDIDVSEYTLEEDLFYDVTADAWYAPYLAYAYENGIIEGYMVEIGGTVIENYPELSTSTPGDVGANVTALQETLKEFGFYKSEVSGMYDSATRAAVAAYQVDRELVESTTSFGAGWFGESTYEYMASEEISEKQEVRMFKPAQAITRAEVAKIAVTVIEAE